MLLYMNKVKLLISLKRSFATIKYNVRTFEIVKINNASSFSFPLLPFLTIDCSGDKNSDIVQVQYSEQTEKKKRTKKE